MSAAPHLLELLDRSPSAGTQRVALVDGGHRLTYAELPGAIEAAAARLARAIDGRPGPVALCANGGIGYALAMFGALHLGREVAEMSPHEPVERRRELIAALAPAVVVGETGRPADGPWPATTVAEFTDAPPASLPRAAVAHGATAFIVFTSGTTGKPKGVMLGHAGVTAVVGSILAYLPLQQDERYALVLPLYHTYGKSVLFTTLSAGGAVHFTSFVDLPRFVEYLADERITAFSGVPYHVHMLLRRAPRPALALPDLRTITVSGSHLPIDALREAGEAFPAAQIHVMYGLTESSTRACALPPSMLAAKAGSAGRPIPGVTLRIVDEQEADVPACVIGEVQLRGPNVMQGYWNDPALSAATLAGGWLRTGDLGYVDEDGFLFLVGRKSDIIKCAGERIGAREVEDVLASHPGVAESVVAGVPHPVLGEAVRAWVVRRHPSLGADELLAYCASHLTHHKIPRTITFLDELPRTASGKVQKHRLPLDTA